VLLPAAQGIKLRWLALCSTAGALSSACRVSAFFAPAIDQVAVEPLALVHLRPTLHPGGHAAALARLLFALNTGVQRLLREQPPAMQPQERFSCLPYALWASFASPALSGCAAPCTLPRRAWHTASYVSKAMLCVIPQQGRCYPHVSVGKLAEQGCVMVRPSAHACLGLLQAGGEHDLTFLARQLPLASEVRAHCSVGS
jgi:hypothetical protein